VITYDVAPHRGVGPVRLGMTRAEARVAMGLKPTPLGRRPAAGPWRIDAYHKNAFQVHVDDEERVEYIELSSGEPSFTATYKGREVLALPADVLVRLVSQDGAYDSQDPELGYSHVFPSLELALWRPVLPEDPDDPDGRHFATVGVGKPGYFSGRQTNVDPAPFGRALGGAERP
jgi:hypothetical protein